MYKKQALPAVRKWLCSIKSLLDRMLATFLLISLSSRLALARPSEGEGTDVVFPGQAENLRVARKYPSNKPDLETEVGISSVQR